MSHGCAFRALNRFRGDGGSWFGYMETFGPHYYFYALSMYIGHEVNKCVFNLMWLQGDLSPS